MENSKRVANEFRNDDKNLENLERVNMFEKVD